MKYFFSILLLSFFLISCNSGTSSDTTSTAPSACACAKNAMKAGTNEFNQSIQTACEEYAATLTQDQRMERAMKALECIK